MRCSCSALVRRKCIEVVLFFVFFSFAAVTAQASTTASIADVVLPHRPVPDFILTNLTAMSAVRVLHEPWYCFR